MDFGDQYRIYDAKYYKQPMALREIHQEIGQVRKIEALNVTGLGFVAADGFEQREDGYSYYDGNDLYG